MPRVDNISSEFRSDAGQSKYPRLKLQAGEKARVVVAGALQVEYLHRLNAPAIVNMAPTYKKIKGDDGSERFVVDTRWVSSPLCTGDFEKLRERGVDEKDCPACFQARERPDIFRAPDMRFAGNVIRYNMRPGGGWADIANPYGVQIQVWVFSDKVYGKLDDIRQMGGQYADLRQVDLLIECSHDGFKFQQPYSKGEFMPFAPAAWMANDAVRQYTAEYLQHNSASEEDLTLAIGRRVKPNYIQEDLDRVIQRWDVVRAYESRQGGAPVMGQGFGAESFASGMTGLQQQYGGQPAPAAPPPPALAAQSAPSAMSLLGGSFTPPPAPAQQDGQWQPPGQPGDMFAPPAAASQPSAPGSIAGMPAAELLREDALLAASQPPAPGQIAGMPAAVSQRADALMAAAQPELAAMDTASKEALIAGGVPASLVQPNMTPQQPPAGLSGLGDLMAGTSRNPSTESPPLTPPAQPGPAAAQAAQPSDQQQYSFADLVNMANKNQGPQ